MRLAGIGLLILLLSACAQKEQKKAQSETYFNLRSYFEKEAERLNKLNLQLDKLVAIGEDVEQKKVNIKDFNRELSTFINSDINKASWRGAFTVKKERNLELYTTENEKIPVKRVEIQYQNNRIRSIKIDIATENILYRSTDRLTYFPDSLYEINKIQKIKLLKEKKYSVIGKFK